MRLPNSPRDRDFQDTTYRVEEATKRINDIDRRLARIEGQASSFAKEADVSKAELNFWKSLVPIGIGVAGSLVSSGIVAAVIFLTN